MEAVMNSGGEYCSRPRLHSKGNTMQIRKRNFTFDVIEATPPPSTEVTSFGMVRSEFDNYAATVADLSHQIEVHGTI